MSSPRRVRPWLISALLCGVLILAACLALLPQGSLQAQGTEAETATLSISPTVYPLPGGSDPTAIMVAPDGTVWFAEDSGRIGRITRSGSIIEYPVLGGCVPSSIVTPSPVTSYCSIDSLALGPDGQLWYIKTGVDRIGRLTTDGESTEFALASGSGPQRLVRGPDGALWFTERSGRIGRITVQGHIVEYTIPNSSAVLGDITVGPDGALWFVQTGCNSDSSGTVYPGRISRLTTDGLLTNYTPPNDAHPHSLTVGPDGALWFTHRSCPTSPYDNPTGGGIGRITTGGAISLYTLPAPCNDSGCGVTDIVSGPDGALWVTLRAYLGPYGSTSGVALGRITPNGGVNIYALPGSCIYYGCSLDGLAAGANALWLTSQALDVIWRVAPDVTTPTPVPTLLPPKTPGPTLTNTPTSIVSYDNFVDAPTLYVYYGYSFFTAGTTFGATLEVGESQPCGAIGATIWFQVVPMSSGEFTASTTGSNFDTVLALYSGTSLSNLTLLACNDDTNGLTSYLSAPVVVGQTYYLQLGGYGGRSGYYQLSYSLTSGETITPTIYPYPTETPYYPFPTTTPYFPFATVRPSQTPTLISLPTPTALIARPLPRRTTAPYPGPSVTATATLALPATLTPLPVMTPTVAPPGTPTPPSVAVVTKTATP